MANTLRDVAVERHPLEIIVERLSLRDPYISSSGVLLASSSTSSGLSPSFLRLVLTLYAAVGAHLRAALGIALGGASRGRSRGLMHAECSRRRPTCTGDDRSGLPASRLQLQRSSRVRCTRTPRLCACTILHEWLSRPGARGIRPWPGCT